MSHGRRRILVVEDNLDSVHSLVLLLRDMGHEVEYAINGYAALDIARRFRPEFVFLDLGLPGLDGFEVCERLKHEPGFESTRFIAITGYAQDEHRTRSAAAGCEQHIVKPVSPRFLYSLLGSPASVQ
jgi:CheY-like chemotaxis protein